MDKLLVIVVIVLLFDYIVSISWCFEAAIEGRFNHIAQGYKPSKYLYMFAFIPLLNTYVRELGKRRENRHI